MKSAFFVFSHAIFLVSILTALDPATEARSRLMERTITGTGSTAKPSSTEKEVIVSYTTFVSAEREWLDVSNRKMKGRLVAFQAPEPGKSGPVIVIKEGKILLRRTGAKTNNEFPLDQLSEADQVFVKSIDLAIKKGTAPTEK